MASQHPIEPQEQQFNTKQNGLSHLSDEEGLARLLMHTHGHDDHDHVIINPIDEHNMSSSFPSTGTHTPPSDHDDEEAVLSDCPSESESELEIPASPPISKRRHRNATSVSEDNFEFPIFLGRQDETVTLKERNSRLEMPETPTVPQNPPSTSEADFDFPVFLGRQDEDVALIIPSAPTKTEPALEQSTIPTLAPEFHAKSLSGPMMSWWPTPVGVISRSAEVEELLNNWWRKDLTDSMDYDWNECHYE